MKGTSWKFSVFIFTAAALLFMIPAVSSAEALLGKVTLVGTDGRTDVYPLVSGGKIAYGQKALLRVTGGTFVVEEGSDLIVAGQEKQLAFRIENGIVHFRIQPQKAVIAFNTKNGNFKTPGVVKAASSIIEGTITVNEKETVLELSEGSMQALTTEGIETVNAGDRMLLVAQAVIDENQVGENANAETPPVSNSTASNVDESKDDDGGNLGGAAVFGGATAAVITGTIIGATTTSGNGSGDSVASPVE